MSKNIKFLLIAIVITLAASDLALGQDSVALSVSPSALRALETRGIESGAIAEGQKSKIEGIVIDQNNQSFTVREAQGSKTVFLVTNKTLIQKKRNGWFYGPRKSSADDIRVGLTLKVEGRGNSDSQLVAKKITIQEPDAKTAKSLQARVRFFEERADSTQAAAEVRLDEVQETVPGIWTIPTRQHCGKCSHVCSQGCAVNSCPVQGVCN